jgi:alpha-1,3-glucosyltransferase
MFHTNVVEDVLLKAESQCKSPSLKRRLQWSVDILVFSLSLLVRYGISTFSYSGKNTPPLYGDYEAHRHWMEVTSHVPVSQWYFYRTDYWGLDYPPLAAYMSYVWGKIGQLIEPRWFALDESWGFESTGHFYFMRMTVMVMDLLVYFTAVRRFVKVRFSNRSWAFQQVARCMLLMQPSLLLIDHGHFQYNCVMLGLALWSINFVLEDRFVLGTCLFVLSMCFKQMSFYYFPAFLAYFLGICWRRRFRSGLILAMKMGFSGLLTALLCFFPFITDLKVAKQVIIRLFPLERGLFEDKVATVWCSISVFIKIHRLFPKTQLLRFS